MRFCFSLRQTIAALLGLILLAGSTAVWAGPPAQLQQLRRARREAMRVRNLAVDKGATAGRFGLLVIPVDFADARLPAEWDNYTLSARLVPDSGETLHNYFRIASGNRLDLSITLAPLVHLPETRRQYSDRDLNGFTRTRKLATESITAVRDLGLEFRRLDNDGPDGLAGTGDDDGEVDGILILHAGIGNENDAQEGLVQALQFFLAEPVTSQGIAASFYAVASLQSGPGIWAHETAHLLGLEDRYDPLLFPSGGSELQSVGGLGRFSLMSSGAWGTGGGFGAALPDAYSGLQMGWLTVRNLPGSGPEPAELQPGIAARVWTQGAVGPEFFLLETRDPAAKAPFDANVPGGQLLIYHVDENLAEGAWQQDGPRLWHLRVRLVEADGDRGLASGANDGSESDLFPGPWAVENFGPSTVPASTGYDGVASRIALTSIQAGAGAVSFWVALDTKPSVLFSYGFGSQGSALPLTLTVQETGDPLPGLSCLLQATSSGEAGFFANSGTRSVSFSLSEQEPGLWVPAVPVNWVPDPSVPNGSATRFEFKLFHSPTVYLREARQWVWQSTGNDLDFHTAWPGSWVIEFPTGNFNTTWQRWDAAPWLTADHRAVLACTGSDYPTADAWPSVTYANDAYTTLTSAALGADVGGVRLTHSIEVEMLAATTGMDGGVVSWLGPDGLAQPAIPLDGYSGRIAARSDNPLHGQEGFAAADLELAGSEVRWHTDIFPVPANGPGPWRLRLSFAANSRWRARGWYVANIEPIGTDTPPVGFTPEWANDLTWTWPWPEGEPVPFAVESRSDASTPWREVLRDDLTPQADGQYRLSGTRLLDSLAGGNRHRHQVRVLGLRPEGEVASVPIVVYPDGGDGHNEFFGIPWPNPATAEVRFLLDIPVGQDATLRVYDVAGRLVTSREYTGGQQLVTWDGLAANGFRVAAGVYYLRLEGSGLSVTHKVVLLH